MDNICTKKQSLIIRYVLGIGFLIFYSYIMLTSKSELAFCYVLVALAIMIVYVDIKFSLGIGIYALFINLVAIAKNAMTTGLTGDKVTNAEISIACVLLTCIFQLMAVSKLSKINKANVDKADGEKRQSEKMLETTLKIAADITDGIAAATTETVSLNSAIHTTRQAMEYLVQGAEESEEIMLKQQKSTTEIDDYITEVKKSTTSILQEIGKTEECLTDAKDVMSRLLV